MLYTDELRTREGGTRLPAAVAVLTPRWFRSAAKVNSQRSEDILLFPTTPLELEKWDKFLQRSEL